MLRSFKLTAVATTLTLCFTLSSMQAELISINSFEDFCWGSIVDTFYSNDDVGFTVSGNIPTDNNYKFGFSIEGGTYFIGSADNYSDVEREYSYCYGDYYEDLPEGQKPTGLYVVHDMDEDGIGTYDTNTGIFMFDSDDKLYTAGDTLTSGYAIEIDGIVNNVSALPAWHSGQLTSMPTINLIPEPSTFALCMLGFAALKRRRRK